MALTRWDRFGLDWPGPWRRWLDRELESAGWLRIEEFQEDGTLVVRAELPGIDPEKDVDVSVSDGMLHISAKREERTEHKAKGMYQSEFRYGELTRDLALPAGVDKESVKAGYKDGILEIRVPWPKESESGATKVPISHT